MFFLKILFKRDNDLENIDLESIENIVHPQWEIRDPNPDIYMLFIKFNQLFFENKLNDVLINWNKRMTALGGAFYEADGGLEICLSEPILKYRSRKAIIETLLVSITRFLVFIVMHSTFSQPAKIKKKIIIISNLA